MNIVLFTQDEPIYMPRYIEAIIEEKSSCISAVILAPPDRTFFESTRQKWEMLGPKPFVRFGLKYAKGKLLDRLPDLTAAQPLNRYYSIRSLAEAYDIPVVSVPDINDRDFIKRLKYMNPDLFLSIACGQIMSEQLTEIPEKDCVNIHGSLLPEYRGLATSFWVLYHGETKSGVTAHTITPDIDSGDIIEQREYPIEGNTMHEVYNKLVDMGAEVAINVLEDYERGTVTKRKNDVENGSYFSHPTKEDREEFLRRGNEFL